MQFLGMQGKNVTVALTAEECDLIADECRDGSTLDNMSVSGELAQNFSALCHVAKMAEPS